MDIGNIFRVTRVAEQPRKVQTSLSNDVTLPDLFGQPSVLSLCLPSVRVWSDFQQRLPMFHLVGGQEDPGQGWPCPSRNINHCCVTGPRNKRLLPFYVTSPGELYITCSWRAAGAVDWLIRGTSENRQQQPVTGIAHPIFYPVTTLWGWQCLCWMTLKHTVLLILAGCGWGTSAGFSGCLW